MKKLLSIVAIVIFTAAITVPVSASSELVPVTVQVNDEEPKKKDGKAEKKSDAKKESSKDCATPCGEKKAPACGEKKAPACGEKEKK